MHPVLFDLPLGGTVNAYGTLILIGGLSSLPGTWWDAKRRGLGGASTASFVVDFWLVVIFGAAIGGRLLHIATMPGPYIDDPTRVFALDDTGFVFFGSLLAIVGGWLWLARRYDTTFGTVCDLGATWMALGHGFGRLGCFFAGCCWGAPCDADFAVTFGTESVAYLAGEVPVEADRTIPLFPIQLFESLGLFAIFAGLLALRVRRGIEPIWRQSSRYAIAYGVLRFLTDALRGDPSRGMIATVQWPALARALGLPAEQPLLLSVSQTIAIALVAIGVYGWRRTRCARDDSDPF